MFFIGNGNLGKWGNIMTTMALSSVNSIHTKRGKNIGTILGAGVGTGYLLKNGKDIFVIGIKEKGSELPKRLTSPVSLGISALILVGSSGVGRLIGAGIGKMIDTIGQHKAEKELMNNPENIDDIEIVSAEEFDDTIETE